MVCKIECENGLRLTTSIGNGATALMGLVLVVAAASAFDVLGVPVSVLCIAAGVILLVISLREVWESLKVQTPKQNFLNRNHEQLDIDKLEHEFKKLASDSKQTKDTD